MSDNPSRHAHSWYAKSKLLMSGEQPTESKSSRLQVARGPLDNVVCLIDVTENRDGSLLFTLYI